MKYFDQHVHSSYSHDSNASLEKYILTAIELGQENFVVTDHCDIYTPDSPYSYYSDFSKEKIEIEELRKKYPQIHIMQGIEVGFNPSAIDKHMQIIRDIDAQLINLSIHYYYDIDFYVNTYNNKEETDKMMRIYINYATKACKEFPDFDVFSHIDYGFKNAYYQIPTLDISEYEPELKEFFEALITRDKVLEINTKVQDRIYDNFKHLRYLLRLYKSLGGKLISLSSDSHRNDEYRRSFDKYLKIIKEEGFNELCCFVDRKRYTINI